MVELNGGTEVEGGDHGTRAAYAVGAMHQSRAIAGKEAEWINLNQTIVTFKDLPLSLSVLYPTLNFSSR